MENNRSSKTGPAVAVTILLTSIVVFAATIFAFRLFNFRILTDDSYEKMTSLLENYEKLDSIANEISEKSLYETERDKQMDALYHALADSVGDEYTQYMSKEEADEWRSSLEGTFYGIGVTIVELVDGRVEVQNVTPKSPAQVAGIQPGDIFTKVDGKTYDNIESMREAIVGDRNTKVTITYMRGEEEKSVTLTRGELSGLSVYGFDMKDDIGYIRITAFQKDTAEEFRTELVHFENKNVKGLIIDLRGNSGGYVDQAVMVADMLLPECTIAYTESRNGEKEFYNSDESVTKLKYVLLVDRYTASASEIVAAAVKDGKTGQLVGEKTYGKGVIQEEITYSDGSLLRVTVQEYYSPNGNRINKKGVEPDYAVELGTRDGKDMQYEKAVSLLD